MIWHSVVPEREQRALGGFFEGESRAGEEDPGEDHGLGMIALAGRMAGCVLSASQNYLS
jgi:hypothetical protein